jgi:putative ABC transport system permease protein
MSERGRGHPVCATAGWGLATYAGIGVVVGLGIATAVAAAGPLAFIPHGGLPLADVVPPSQPYQRPPAWLRAEAVRLLGSALGGTALAAAVVGAFGVLLVFAALAGLRSDERAIRRAVGASRRILFAAAMAEAAAVSALGLLGGVAVGSVGWAAALARWPGPAVSIGGGPLVWLGGAALAGGLVLAALAHVFTPARRLTDAEPRPSGLAIPVIQLGVALIVLTAGALLGRAEPPPAAVGPDGLILRAATDLSDPAARSRALASVLAALRARGGYDTVSLTSDGAVYGLGTVTMVTTDCGLCPAGGLLVPQHSVVASEQFVSADSFQALGVRLMAGRGITSADQWGSRPVAVVSPDLARRHFQNGEAIGRRLQLGDDPRTWYTVVGVAQPAPPRGLGAALVPRFTVYASVLQHPPGAVELHLRPGTGPPVRLGSPAPLLAAALGIAPQQVRVAGEAGLLGADRAALAWFARAFALEGWLALLLAGLGTSVQLRLWLRALAPELGVRRALGARRRRLLLRVLVRAAGVGVAGLALGLALGPPVWQSLGTVIRGIPAWDSGLVVRYGVVLTATAVAAAGWPAVRLLRRAPAALLSER